MVGLREAGLYYRYNPARTGHAAMTVMHVWNQWREEGRTQRLAGTGPRNVTTARDDRHLVRMDVTDRRFPSTVFSRYWSTATGLDLSVSTACRRLLRAGLVARVPLRRLPLSSDHQRLRLQLARESRHWRAEWQNVVFSDESRFSISYNDVRHYACDATLGRFYCLRYCPSFRQLHMPYFSRTMPGHTWQGVYKPFSNGDGYHCFPALHVCQICRPSNTSGISMVGDVFIMVLQHLLLTLCGLAYKLGGGTFPRKISRASDSMPRRIETS